MTEKIIELFLKMAEYRNTQLIITSHESRLLADDLLRNDEINFILKTPSGSSIINPLEKYQLRADKKVYAALFDGTLDAIPIFNTNKLESLVQKSSR
jgi:AAA15 family ATPase/GTPase